MIRVLIRGGLAEEVKVRGLHPRKGWQRASGGILEERVQAVVLVQVSPRVLEANVAGRVGKVDGPRLVGVLQRGVNRALGHAQVLQDGCVGGVAMACGRGCERPVYLRGAGYTTKPVVEQRKVLSQCGDHRHVHRIEALHDELATGAVAHGARVRLDETTHGWRGLVEIAVPVHPAVVHTIDKQPR